MSPVKINQDSPHELSHRVGHDDDVDITKDIHMGVDGGERRHDSQSLRSGPTVSDRVSSAGGASSSTKNIVSNGVAEASSEKAQGSNV